MLLGIGVDLIVSDEICSLVYELLLQCFENFKQRQ